MTVHHFSSQSVRYPKDSPGALREEAGNLSRQDARVLSTAVAKEIGRNISGLKFQPVAEFAQGAMDKRHI